MRRHLAACAPRMLRRLRMWQSAAGARSKTPMPPPASAQAAGFAESEAPAAMRAYLERSLRAGGVDFGGLAGMAYADLPPCAIH